MTTDINHSRIDEPLPVAGVELIKQFTHCQLQAYPNPCPNDDDGYLYLLGWACDRHKDGTPFFPGESITQLQADELLECHLRQRCLPILRELPNWVQLNENQQGALLSFAHSLGQALGQESTIFSARSLLGQSLRHRRWYQVPSILSGYYGHNSSECISYRRQEEAILFRTEVQPDRYVVINRSRLLAFKEPALTGRDVRELQLALIGRGFEIAADGLFDSITQWAVEKFQAMVGLPATGIADVATQRILYARPLCMNQPYLIGSDVREIQAALARIGYAVDVNGIFNPRTLEALLAFQKYFDLPEDGILQDRTLVKLLYWPDVVAVS